MIPAIMKRIPTAPTGKLMTRIMIAVARSPISSRQNQERRPYMNALGKKKAPTDINRITSPEKIIHHASDVFSCTGEGPGCTAVIV